MHRNVTGVAPSKSWVGCKDFRVIGENRVTCFHGSQASPSSALKDRLLEVGQHTGGWCIYRVRADVSAPQGGPVIGVTNHSFATRAMRGADTRDPDRDEPCQRITS